MKNKILTFFFGSCVAFLPVLFFSGIAFAKSPYIPSPGTVYLIQSEYLLGNETGFGNPKDWFFESVQTENNGWEIRFYGKRPNGTSTTPFCTLVFSSSGEVSAFQAIGNLQVPAKDGVLLMSGFPVPCDVLPFPEKGGGALSLAQERKAGDKVFQKTIKVIRANADLETAQKNGWVEDDFQGALEWLRAEDANGELLVRQLWSPDHPHWWIYEETPHRRSWRVPKQ